MPTKTPAAPRPSSGSRNCSAPGWPGSSPRAASRGPAWAPRLPGRDRKVGYLAHLRAVEDPSALLVAAADKLHNCRSLLTDIERHGRPVFDRFNASPADTVWFYRSVVEVLAEKLPREPMVTELAVAVERLAGEVV